jgi:hypothetical protein
MDQLGCPGVPAPPKAITRGSQVGVGLFSTQVRLQLQGVVGVQRVWDRMARDRPPPLLVAVLVVQVSSMTSPGSAPTTQLGAEVLVPTVEVLLELAGQVLVVQSTILLPME